MWAVIPASCRSAPESAGWTLGSDECFQLLEQSVTWRGKQRASKSWQRAWKKDLWIQHLCGRISSLSTAQHGVEQWISSLRDTPVSLSAPQANAGAQTTQGTSGLTLRESSEKSSQGLLFSKTSKDTSAKGSTKSSKKLPNWGSMQSGVYTAQPKPDFPTAGTGSSSWPTATVNDSTGSAYAYSNGDHNKVVLKLPGAAKNWPTPTARDHKDGTDPSLKEPTKGRLGLAAPRTTGAMFPNTSGLRLNPIFVESLMGFPIGWTAFAPLATQSFPSKPN